MEIFPDMSYDMDGFNSHLLQMKKEGSEKTFQIHMQVSLMFI